MCGWCSRATVRISRRKRSPPPPTLATSGLSTLSATGRSCFRSRARNTLAIPPRPTCRSMRYLRSKELLSGSRGSDTGCALAGRLANVRRAPAPSKARRRTLHPYGWPRHRRFARAVAGPTIASAWSPGYRLLVLRHSIPSRRRRRRRPRALAWLALVLAVASSAACRRERAASVEELYAARMAGLSYLQRNQLAEAESAFRKITELAPDDPLGYANLGLTYLQSGRLPDAEQQLRRARELDPGSAEVGLALARLYSLTGRPADARAMLEQLRRDTTGDAHVLYALAELDAGQTDSASARRYEDRLREVLAVAPANLVARLKLADAFARRGAADSAVRQLEEARRIPPEPPKEARARLDSAIQLLRAGQLDQARSTMGRFVGLMEVTQPYQASLEEVKWTEGPIPGRLVLSYSPKDFVSVHGVRERAAADLAKLVDATSDAGLDIPQARASGGAAGGGPAALAAGDVDGDGRDDLFVSAWSPAQGRSVPRLYRVQGGFLRDATDASGIALPQGASYATFADYDNDGWLDLFAIDATGGARLFRNRGNGSFVDETAKAGLAAVAGARKAVLVDLDHDGRSED